MSTTRRCFFSWSLSLCLSAVVCSRHAPRMMFTAEEASMPISTFPDDFSPVSVLPGQDAVTVVGRTDVVTCDFRTRQKMLRKKVEWEGCEGCQYSISVVHQRKGVEGVVVVCASRNYDTICCDLTLSDEQPMCRRTGRLDQINAVIRDMLLKRDEHSILVESPEGDSLLSTYSGFQELVGVHKLGKDKVGPANHDKERRYKGLILSRNKKDPLQDKVYAFYNEKDTYRDVTSKMWIPFVTQLCLADKGGSKNVLQFTWTSQLSARLYCGDTDTRSGFFELVDVATIHAESWQETKIYALFRNEWSVSAVCVYTVKDFDDVFRESRFRLPDNERPRQCVKDSTKLDPLTLNKIARTTEMKDWVKPAKNSGPVFTNHHNYTRIYVDTREQFPVLFLSMNNGGLHKVVQLEGQSFILAEYRPFGARADVLSITASPLAREVYMGSRRQLARLDTGNCQLYGDTCQQCVLARDPHCGWDGQSCSSETQNTTQEVASGNIKVCDKSPTKDRLSIDIVSMYSLPVRSSHFLRCPMSSRHARYAWTHRGHEHACSRTEHECLHLISNMSEEQEGSYRCESEEGGYTRVVAQYHLQLESGTAAISLCRLLLLTLVLVLLSN